MADSSNLKRIACAAIDTASEDLNNVSQEIWNHPELNFEEKYAHDILSTFLEKNGFQVQRNYILETGFRGMHGSNDGGPHVSVISEYDALPDIGHACGHNLIAEVGVGAGLGIKAAMDAAKKSGKALGKLTVLGTPAEEGGGGKIDLIKNQAFQNIDISMMCHPFNLNMNTCDALLAIVQNTNNTPAIQAHDPATICLSPKLKVTVIGTPAEEGGGGKLDMIKANTFSEFDISMMCHPWNVNTANCDVFLARYRLHVTYKGKASHAAGFPWEGINALDAAVMAYNNVSVMRQQMKPNWRIHGVITNGGAKPNIIPELTEMEFYLRAPKLPELEILKAKATKCFEAAAVATGCKVELKWHPKPYYNVITNRHLADLFEDNATQLGVEFCKDERTSTASGSTDMGNVSQVVPSIHPMFSIGSDAVNHTRDFTTASGDPKAQPYTITQAKALAMTAIDVMCNPENLSKIKEGFKQDLKMQGV